MAILFGFLSSRGFLWLQLAIFVWQAIRPAATMRIPWVLFSSAVYKIFSKKTFDKVYFVLLSTDDNDTADAIQFCEDNKGKIAEHTIGDSSVIVFEYNKCQYICDSEKASNVRLLIAAELNNVPIVKECKVINCFISVWTLCSADEAIRMCLPSKRFRLSFRKRVRSYLIEHMPLLLDTYWISKVLSGIPLYLNAKGNEELSSILTLALIILDFTYNIWVPLLEKAYATFVRCVQLSLSMLPLNIRVFLFYLLSNFDNKFLPCSISDLKVKIKKTKVFYTTDNAVLNCPIRRITKVRFDEVDISRNVFDFQRSAGRVRITILENRNNFIEFELWMLGVLLDLLKAKYTMSRLHFQSYIGCWEGLEKGKIGLVQTVDEGFIKRMHLLGFEESINLFWGSNVNVYEVEVVKEYYFLISG